MRSVIRRLAQIALRGAMREWPPEEMALSAVVFAPHQDDETLGCGGTILRKIRAGAEVKIVFMTDGAQSHPHLLAGPEMRSVRIREALTAARALGIEEDDVIFLDYPDGKLTEHRAAAAAKVAELLQHARPAQVFVPYYLDGPPDHLATTASVLAALRASNHEATVYEYPIWFWYHWPWTAVEGWNRAALGEMRRGIAKTWRLFWDCRSCVRISDLLDLKRAALAEHRSQVQGLRTDVSWLTLGDIANGDWLACFFQKHEIFYHPPRQELLGDQKL